MKSTTKHSFLFFIICLTGIYSQNIDMYLSLIDEGKIEEVQANLPSLELKHANDPGVLYLKALIHKNGEESIEMYRQLMNDHPSSQYADDAAMKIGEYLYARGLYSQASKAFRAIPVKYSNTNQLERSIQLMVNSYLATGEEDSARIYLRLFGEKYPKLNIHGFGLSGLEDAKKTQLVQIDRKTAQKKIATAKENRPKPTVTIAVPSDVPKPWVIQVGAFGNYTNAKNLKLKLGEAGYSVMIGEIVSRGRRLHVVRVQRYATREEALDIGADLNKRFGLEFRVLNVPEKG